MCAPRVDHSSSKLPGVCAGRRATRGADRDYGVATGSALTGWNSHAAETLWLRVLGLRLFGRVTAKQSHRSVPFGTVRFAKVPFETVAPAEVSTAPVCCVSVHAPLVAPISVTFNRSVSSRLLLETPSAALAGSVALCRDTIASRLLPVSLSPTTDATVCPGARLSKPGVKIIDPPAFSMYSLKPPPKSPCTFHV